jgi:hypothetical protein
LMIAVTTARYVHDSRAGYVSSWGHSVGCSLNNASVTGLSVSIPFFEPVAGVLLLSGVGAWPPPNGVG